MVEVVLIQVKGFSPSGRGGSHGGSQSDGGHSHCYAFPGRPEAEASDAEASDAVITGIIPVCHRPATVLFDPGSTYSYVFTYFAPSLDILCESLDLSIRVSTPVGDSVVVDWVYRLCTVTLMRYDTHADSKVLDMIDFNVILGMDWFIFLPRNFKLSCQDHHFRYAWNSYSRMERFS